MARAVAVAAANVANEQSGATVVGLQVIPGNGVRGSIDGRQFTIGSSDFAVTELGNGSLASSPAAAPATTLLWDDKGPIASFSFREQVRDSAAPALSQLRRLEIGTGVLSGDHRLDAIVPDLIAPNDAFGGLTAASKVEHVRSYRRFASTAMVGDGLNDAPALAAADVGIAVGAATDLARISADAIILGDDLRVLPWLFAHGRRVRRVMLQNLAWATVYNLVAIAMAAMGKLNPMIAAIVMVVSSILVVANSRRLLI
jgi:Cu2+-exporting ATPase